MTIEYRFEQLIRFGDAFNSHLEKCRQCEVHPFNLCPTGHVLLNAAGGNSAFNERADAILKGKESA